VIVTVDDESKKLLRFVVREEPDPDDHARFQRETAAHDSYVQRMEAFVREAQAYQTASEAMAVAGMPMDPTVQPPMPPPPPTGIDVDPESLMPEPVAPQRVREICFFTHYRLFPSEGFYGLGFGDFIAGLNKAVNTLINQHIDGGTLRNSMPGFISAQMKGQRGSINVQPGELIEVDAPMGSIKDGMHFPEFPPPDPTTMRAIANATGGKTYTAQTSSKLSSVYKTLGSSIGRTHKRIEITSWLAPAAAGFLLLAGGARALFSARVP